MKNICIAFILLAAAASASTTLTVTDVSQNPASGVVAVTYTLAGDPAVVTFGATTNGVALAGGELRRAGGAVNKLIRPGSGNVFYWCPYDNARGAVLGDAGSFAVQLSAWPTNSPPDYMVVDLRGCSSSGITIGDFQYYTSTNAFPAPVTDRRYKTDFMVMRRIPAKNVVWRMGSPTTEKGREADVETTHYVKLTNDYYMAIYELTDRQARYMGGAFGSASSYGIATNLPYAEYDTYPVMATYHSNLRGWVWPTNTYNLTAGRITTIRQYTGLRLDLPTDAQWEFACRAGEQAALPNGKELSDTGTAHELDDIAWYVGNSATQSVYCGVIPMPHPVGLKAPNAWGLYDMLGNVSEPCLDWWEPITLAGRPDPATGVVYEEPIGPDVCYNTSETDNGYRFRRVARGGSFSTAASHCRSAHRHGWNVNYGDGPGYTYPASVTTDVQKRLLRGSMGIRLACPALAVR